MGKTFTETATGQETWVRQSQARDMGEIVTETDTDQETWVRQSQVRRHG